MMFAACSSREDYEQQKTEKTIKIEANVKGIQTRAGMDTGQLQNTSFYTGPGQIDIVVYLTKTSPKWQDVKSCNGSSTENSLNTGLATPFTFVQMANNVWMPDDYDWAYIYFPESEYVDAVGVYPALFDFSMSSFTVETDQSTYTGYRKSDLMLATNLNYHSTDGTIPLTFEHQLAKLVVVLNADNISSEELATTKIEYGWDGDLIYYPVAVNVEFTGLDASKPTEDFSMTLTPMDNTENEVINLGTYNAEGNSAVVIPCEVPANQNFLTITVGTTKYYCCSNQKVVFEQGKVTTVNVTLEKDRVYMSNVEITDWTSGSTNDATGSVL